jgi:mono/diheme cytochrome c family protein
MRNFSSDFRKLVRSLVIVTAITLGATSFVFAQDVPADSAAAAAPASGPAGDAIAGEALFATNCKACHALDKRVLGPALAGVGAKYNDDDYLHKWIKNSPALIAAGDKRAVAIYEEYNKAIMPPFPQLSDDEITNIMAYMEVGGQKKADVAAAPAGATTEDTGVSNFMLIGLISVVIIAFLVILMLNKVIATLERLLLNKGTSELFPSEEEVEEESASGAALLKLKKFAKNKKLVFFVVLGLIVVLASFGSVTMWNVGVQQGYQPVQPIKFSHQLHAGTNQIDCQYCHSGAWKSQNATIPSLNVCMNCHKYVQATDNYGGEISPEIKKIYTALDYNPETQQYGDNPKPIEWVRIHNLPDLAYFNHSQHVQVAGIDCQKCHGPIETMEEVYQYSPLTMKWCINCHKETEVNHEGNSYYDKVIAAHEKIKKGEKVTAAVLGGLECGKCHY